MSRALGIAAAFVALCGCGGTTGDAHVRFAGAAAGPADASGGPLEFMTPTGFHVVLESASLHVGAIDSNQTQPASGRPTGACYLPGIYVAQVLGGLDVDLLLPGESPFPAGGDGIAVPAVTGEVWLTGGAIDAQDDRTPILTVAGVADHAGVRYPFSGVLTIGARWQKPAPSGQMPGANPLCLERIASPIPVDLTPRSDGTLLLRADPRFLFSEVDFSSAPADPKAPGSLRFGDDPTEIEDIHLFNALHATSVYVFTWE